MTSDAPVESVGDKAPNVDNEKPRSARRPLTDREIMRLSNNCRRIMLFATDMSALSPHIADLTKEALDFSIHVHRLPTDKSDERCTLALTYVSKEDATNEFKRMSDHVKLNCSAQIKFGDELKSIGNTEDGINWVRSRSRHVSAVGSHIDDHSHSDQDHSSPGSAHVSPRAADHVEGEKFPSNPPRRSRNRPEDKYIKLVDVPTHFTELQILGVFDDGLQCTLAYDKDGKRFENGLAYIRLRRAETASNLIKAGSITLADHHTVAKVKPYEQRRRPAKVRKLELTVKKQRQELNMKEVELRMNNLYTQFHQLAMKTGTVDDISWTPKDHQDANARTRSAPKKYRPKNVGTAGKVSG